MRCYYLGVLCLDKPRSEPKIAGYKTIGKLAHTYSPRTALRGAGTGVQPVPSFHECALEVCASIVP